MENFENRLKRLEQISDKIRQGDLELESSVKLFEEGIKLAKSLEKELSKIERKIEILINEPEKSGEAPALELFPEMEQENGE
ncbi:MAG: exodeoxyribonuclease VII small subunit [Spirochaetia bacterium]